MSSHDAPAPDQTPLEPRQGLLVFKRFKLGFKLGQDSQGTTWLARDEDLDREVDLKILSEAVLQNATALAELRQNVKRAMELKHPNIARIHEFLTDGTMAAVCMEHVQGEKLSNLRRKEPLRCFSVTTLRPWIGQLCSALNYAHGKALLLHRGLKPASLMIDRQGNLKVTDFGITALLPEGTNGSGQQEGGAEDRLFMSPQQRRSETLAATDDIYAFGATLFELLSSKLPFPQGTPLAHIQDKAIPTVEQRRANLEIIGMDPVPDDWEKTIAACLSREPGDRPQSVKEVAERLLVDTEPVDLKIGKEDKRPEPDEAVTKVKETPKPARSPLKIRRGLAVGLGVTVLLVALGYLFGIYLPERRRQEAARQRLEQAQLQWKSTRQELARGGMIVETHPPGVEVKVGEMETRLSPVSFDNLRLKEYTVALHKAGYEDQNLILKVEENRITEAKAIKMKPSLGSALIASEPEGIDYILESRNLTAPELSKVLRRGKTPAQEAELPIGSYLLSCHREGWQDKSMELTVTRNALVSGKMDFVGGNLSLKSEPSGLEFTVEANDADKADIPRTQLTGKTPAQLDGLPPGSYQVKMRRSGWPEQSAVLELSRDALTEKTFLFNGGSLSLKSHPEGVSWKFEKILPGASPGKLQGITPVRLEELPAGDYEVSMQRQGGWAKQRLSVSISPGQVTELKADFPSGRTVVNSKPSGAEVYIGKKLLGVTPLTVSELVPGPTVIVLKLEGYQSGRIATELIAGKDLILNSNLIAFSGPNEGNEWVVPGLGIKLVPIEAGQFLMGSPENEPGHEADETQHAVAIEKPFWLGGTEVTQGQYEALMGTKPSYYTKAGKDAPVEQVSWLDAMAFCAKLNERERAAGRIPADYEYSLPTESQWEYACRAGSSGPIDGDLASSAWYEATSGSSTHPVAKKLANAWGLHDMRGNVWEWCSDWYGVYPPSTARDPSGAEAGSERVYRGACWGNAARACRAAVRNKGVPNLHVSGLGFRVALVPLSR